MMSTRRLAILLTLGPLLAVPGMASAASGRLVIAPLNGPGLITATPGGGQARRICTQPALCGTPTAPSVSPNGEGIAFIDRHTGRPVIIAPDGTCLWCLGAGALASGPGAEVTFAANDAITVAGRRGTSVRVVSLTGTGTQSDASGTVTDADLSRDGTLAIARRGTISIRAA
jgi:hypothetical protein